MVAAPQVQAKPQDEHALALAHLGDPDDYESLWYAPLRAAGVSVRTLAAYDVHVTWRPDDRKAHPGQTQRLYWRYPIWDEEGQPLTWRLVAVDGEHKRSRWDWTEHPDLIYEPLIISRGSPLIVCGDVLSVWVLASLDIAACTFLCGPGAKAPPSALAQIASAGPSSVLVVDNERGCLPGGAMAVARALRAAGVPATYARLRVPTSVLGLGDAALHHLCGAMGSDRQRVLDALAGMIAERTR